MLCSTPVFFRIVCVSSGCDSSGTLRRCACVFNPYPFFRYLFSGCVFNSWDAANTKQPAIIVSGGDALVRGCDFQSSHPGGQLLATAGARKVIFTENLISGVLNVNTPGAKLAIVKDNAPDS